MALVQATANVGGLIVNFETGCQTIKAAIRVTDSERTRPLGGARLPRFPRPTPSKTRSKTRTVSSCG